VRPLDVLEALRLRVAEHLPSMALALGYESMGPWADCHRELMAHIDRPADGRKRLTLIPRGHLKTSLITVCRILQRIRQRPAARVLLASSTATLSQGILREIRGHLRGHLLFADLAGTSKQWTETAEAVTVIRPRSDRTPTIRSVGVGGVTVGEHYDLLVLDDVVTRETCSTKDQMAKLREWYRMLLPMAEPNAEIIIIGTRYHYGDLYSDLLGEHEETADMADGVEAYVRRAVEGGAPIWPSKYSLDTLAGLQAQMGSYLYGCQFMNDPTDPDSAIFRRDHIRWADEGSVPPREECIRVTVTDWAQSEKTSSDYTVIATVDVDRQARKWVRKLSRGRWGPDRQAEAVDKACEHLAEWQPQRVGVQKAMLDRAIGSNLKIRAAELRLPFPIIELSLSESSKFDRIVGLQPSFEGASFFFVDGCLDGLTAVDLEDEILRYPKAPHDDILDALADVDRVAERVPQRVGAPIPRRSTQRRY
jgi:hypothetical protein